MADTVNVKPTPIQRNRLDVAIELVGIHTTRVVVKADEIENLFAKYYALVTVLESKPTKELQDLLSPELLSKIGRLNEMY
jgi:hypothetical protein